MDNYYDHKHEGRLSNLAAHVEHRLNEQKLDALLREIDEELQHHHDQIVGLIARCGKCRTEHERQKG